MKRPRAALVAVGGLVASGKSTVARERAAPFRVLDGVEAVLHLEES